MISLQPQPYKHIWSILDEVLVNQFRQISWSGVHGKFIYDQTRTQLWNELCDVLEVSG